MTEIDTRTETFQAARKALVLAVDALRKATETLPALPDDGQCCDSPDMRVITVGLEQWCEIHFEGGYLASTDGWDDMGDMDGPSYIACSNCGQEFATPTDLDWT